jgi:hypothetical protein
LPEEAGEELEATVRYNGIEYYIYVTRTWPTYGMEERTWGANGWWEPVNLGRVANIGDLVAVNADSYGEISKKMWGALVKIMDEEIREDIAEENKTYTDAEFWARYCNMDDDELADVTH